MQWILLLLFGAIFYFFVPFSRTKATFFAAESAQGKQPNALLLTSSLVISWIFAKSITVAANLGLSLGWMGGVAYGVYYASFIVAGIVIYRMRTKGGFKSIHEFLNTRYGRSAVLLFTLLIAFRLFNEVWSNTMVIGSYFGEAQSTPYYLAILVFTAITLAYTLKGGLQSSLMTDLIQLVFFGVLISILLYYILPDKDMSLTQIFASKNVNHTAGTNLMLVAFLQIFSYPFHDPVLTDRGFISSPKVTLKSFLWASVIGFICIVTFSSVGVFAKIKGLEGQAAVEVSKLLGTVAMLVMNFIMVTSAASTLDSTFSSFSKLVVIDLGIGKAKAVKSGRLAMLGLVILGTLPVFANPAILSATTVSGTMVMGLAPVFLFWHLKAPALSYFLSIGFGIVAGIFLTIGTTPASYLFNQAKYADLLSINLYGVIICFILFFIPYFYKKWQASNT